jgi:glyoxylase-like metal-dependent hydrolase (beta-lactamase superfamily II)
VNIHVFETGRLRGNETFMRAQGWAPALLKRRIDLEFPVYSFLIEHPEGVFAIDTGLGRRVDVPGWQRRTVPTMVGGPLAMDGAMRRRGLDPADVSHVILTHLDWDHAGGVERFPGAEVLVHRPEYESATSRLGGVRYQTRAWPDGFSPTLYDLEREPFGPFPTSLTLTRRGDLRLVPLPGHSAGQVGVVVTTEAATLVFAADHVLRQDWFIEDYAAGRLLGLGIFQPRDARETSRRLHRLIEDTGAILLPSHDDEVPQRLATVTAADEFSARKRSSVT